MQALQRYFFFLFCSFCSLYCCVPNNLVESFSIKQGSAKIQQNRGIYESSLFNLMKHLKEQLDVYPLHVMEEGDAEVNTYIQDINYKVSRVLTLLCDLNESFSRGALFFKPQLLHEFWQICKSVSFSPDVDFLPHHVRELAERLEIYSASLKRYVEQKKNFLLEHDLSTLSALVEFCDLSREIFIEENFVFSTKQKFKDYLLYLPMNFIKKHVVELSISATVIGVGLILYWLLREEKQLTPEQHKEKLNEAFDLWSQYGASVPVRAPNNGNTCFLNSVVQTIISPQPIREAMMRDGLVVPPDITSRLQQALRDIRNATVALGAGKFRKWRQEDAAEFLLFLLDQLHHDGDEAPHAVRQACLGGWRTILRNRGLRDGRGAIVVAPFERIKAGDDDFLIMPLSLASHGEPITLDRLLRNNTAWGEIGAETDDGCTLKRSTISRLPRVLAISLSRFRKKHKIMRPVTLPEKLDFTAGPLHNCLAAGVAGKKYRISAIVVHRGETMRSGHYVAYVRRTNAAGLESWFCCNDENIKALPARALEDGYPKILSKGIEGEDGTPYIVLYEEVAEDGAGEAP